MKRRNFLTATGTVGIVGVVSGSTVLSSAYNSISTSVALEEFKPATKDLLHQFIAEVKDNVQSLGLEENITNLVTMPIRIIRNDSESKDQKIVYKNQSGEYITMSVVNGRTKIEVSKS